MVEITSRYKVVGESIMQMDTSMMTVTVDKVLTREANKCKIFVYLT